MKKIKDLEILLMKNISFVTLFLIVVILSIDILPHLINKIYWTNYNFISTIQTISTLGAILFFWYWYKRHERDKEMEMIWNLTEPNNSIELINDWHIKRVLFEKWYMEDYIWEIIEADYQIKFYEYIGILKDLPEINESVIIDKTRIINRLITYESSKNYFVKQLETIEVLLSSQAKFLKNICTEDTEMLFKIAYFERLSKEVNKIFNSNNSKLI